MRQTSFKHLLNWLKTHKEPMFLSATLHALALLVLSWIVMSTASTSGGIGPVTTIVSFVGENELAETLDLLPDKSEIEQSEETASAESQQSEPEQPVEESLRSAEIRHPTKDQPPVEEPLPVDETASIAEPLSASESSDDQQDHRGSEVKEIERRRAASGGRGDGQIVCSVVWSDFSDVDLAVTCPDGQTVYHKRKVGTFGQQDVDSNSGMATQFGAGNLTRTPIENYCQETATPGIYQTSVTLFQQRGEGAVSYTLGIWVLGEQRLYDGVLDRKHREDQYSFEVLPEGGVVWISNAEYHQRIHQQEHRWEELLVEARSALQLGDATTARSLLRQLISGSSPASVIHRKAKLALVEIDQPTTNRSSRRR